MSDVSDPLSHGLIDGWMDRVQPPPPPNLPLGVLLLRCQVNYMSPDSPGSPFRKGGITPITLNEMKLYVIELRAPQPHVLFSHKVA